MTRGETLESEIRTRLAAAIGDQVSQVKVADDPYGGVRVLVSSPGFDGWSWPERLQATFGGDPPEDVMWFDIVTPEEVDDDIEERLLSSGAQLPLWPNRL